MRGTERQVSIKTILHLLAAVESKGQQRLEEIESSHRKAQAVLERKHNTPELAPELAPPQRPAKPQKKKQKPYEPLSVY